MTDYPAISSIILGAAGGIIVAVLNQLFAWLLAVNKRMRTRRYLALRVAHQLEAYAIQCNDNVEIFLDAIQPMVPEFPPQIESDAFEFLDHGVVDRYLQFTQRPFRENRRVMCISDQPDASDTGVSRSEWELNHSMCTVRDEAVRLAKDFRDQTGLRRRKMDWKPLSRSPRI